MRTLAAAITVGLLAACDSKSDPVPPVFGGFEVRDQAAVIYPPVTCDVPGLGTASVSAVMVYFVDYAGACDVIAQIPGCGTRESSAAVMGLAVSGLTGGGAVAAAGPGTYPLLRNAPTTAAFLAATGDAGKVGLACAPVTGGGNLDLTSGEIVLGSVSDTNVSGRLEFRFDDGTGFDHAIDATVCPVTRDLCQLWMPCWDGYACVPAP